MLPCAGFGIAVDDGPVDLARRARLEHLAEMRRRGAGLGHHQHARRIAVEPVHQPRRLALLVGQALQQPIHMPLGAAAALRGEPVRLVEDVELVVLVEDQVAQELRVLVVDLLLDALATSASSGGMRTSLPGLEPRIGLGPAAVDPHLPGADQLLQMPERHLREMHAEPAVEPHAVFVARDGLLPDAAHAAPRASATARHRAPRCRPATETST